MPKKTLSLLMVIMLLAASALACNTVTGGSAKPDGDDLQATADALGLDPAAEATIAAAETEAASLTGDDGNANDNGNDSNSNDNTGDTGDGSTDNPFGQGPADIPVLDTNAELVLGDDTTLTYYTDATFDETVDFYRTEMINSGWEAAANGDVVFGGIASLQFNKDGKQALIAITTDPTSNRTLVAVTITGG